MHFSYIPHVPSYEEINYYQTWKNTSLSNYLSYLNYGGIWEWC